MYLRDYLMYGWIPDIPQKMAGYLANSVFGAILEPVLRIRFILILFRIRSMIGKITTFI